MSSPDHTLYAFVYHAFDVIFLYIIIIIIIIIKTLKLKCDSFGSMSVSLILAYEITVVMHEQFYCNAYRSNSLLPTSDGKVSISFRAG